MKRKILQRIDIEIDSERGGEIQVMRHVLPPRLPIDSNYKWSFYPLTEKNYWRAVAMQLRLAGFVSLETHKEKLFDEGYQFSL